MIGRFYRENRDIIKIALCVLLMIAGIVIVAKQHVLLGILFIFIGIFLICLSVGKILGPSDYASGGLLNGINGMGRQQSSINKKPKSTVANEVTSDIWNQMKEKNNEE